MSRFNYSPDNVSIVKWYYNRILVHLLFNHFFNWLEISEGNTKNKLAYYQISLEDENIPFYLIRFPGSSKELPEFHWWSLNTLNKISNRELKYPQTETSMFVSKMIVCLCRQTGRGAS